MIIKVLLVAAALALAVMLLRGRARATHQAVLRLAGLGLVLVGITAVLFPGITVWAAHLVGVRRGTDLVLYVAVVTFAFVTVTLYQRMHTLETQITTLARELALAPGEKRHAPDSPLAGLAPDLAQGYRQDLT
jgi:hypothetical protein